MTLAVTPGLLAGLLAAACGDAVPGQVIKQMRPFLPGNVSSAQPTCE